MYHEEQPAEMRSAEEGAPAPDGEGSTLVKMRCSPQGFGCSEVSNDQQVPKWRGLFLPKISIPAVISPTSRE